MRYFYKEIEINVPEGVYCPREDSELLAKALENMDLKGKLALEVGCGSGFLSILMAKNGAHVTAVDVNPEAVEATKENAYSNNVNINVLKSDMFEKVRGRYDIIVFNPPYLPTTPDEQDDTYSGGVTGREVIEVFVSYAKSYVRPDGRIIIIISSLTGEEETISMFREAGFEAYAIARQKVPWEELILIEACPEQLEGR